MSGEAVNNFISDRLFTNVQPVTITDLIQKFKIGPSAAKQALYHYYKDIQNVKYQCVIIIVYSDNRITIVKDLASIENEDEIKDCFIYALNPIDEFIPNNPAIDQYKCIPITNPYKLEVEHPRPSTVGAQPSRVPHKSTAERSKTVPGGVTAGSVRVTGSAAQKKTKDMGLKSTALLAKMKKERAMKEEERQRELHRRKQEELEYRTKSDKKRASQLNDLQNLFVSDDDDNDDDEEGEKYKSPKKATDGHSRSHQESSQSSPKRLKTEFHTAAELIDILDTTAEESLLKSSQSQNTDEQGQKEKTAAVDITVDKKPTEEETPGDTVSSYVDKDGYIVTKKVSHTLEKHTTSTNRPRVASFISSIGAKKSHPQRRKQGTIESFFKKSK